jgi:hypothetical protein
MRVSEVCERLRPLASFVSGDTDAAPQSRTGHIRDRSTQWGFVLEINCRSFINGLLKYK